MIIWSGLGFFVAVFTFVFALIGQLSSNYFSGDKNYWDQNRWVLGLALLAAGVASWYLDSFLDRPSGKVLVDNATRNEVTLKRKHSFFFIRMRYWGPILGVIGVVVIIANLGAK